MECPLRGPDDCYIGAMDAAAHVQAKQIIFENLTQLAVAIVKASLRLITTGSPAGDFLLKVGIDAVDVAGKVFHGEPVVQSITIAVVNEVVGYIVSKAAGDYVNGVDSLLTDLASPQVVKALLDREGVLSWTLSGSNTDSSFVDIGGPLTSITAKLYYNPWTHYTTAVVGATCEMPSGPKRMMYLLTYEQSKSMFGTAVPIYDSLRIRSISDDGHVRYLFLPPVGLPSYQ